MTRSQPISPMIPRPVLLFHHDPLHSDEFLDDFGATAKQAWQTLGRDATELELGMEGSELSVGPPVPAVHA